MNPTVRLTLAGYQLDAELALGPQARERGLMGRTQMPDTNGMVLCFPHPHIVSIWMRNTPLPLSAAFLDENRRIINTADLEPFNEYHYHQPLRPAQYVLEVNRGWFWARQITAGARADFQIPQGMAIT